MSKNSRSPIGSYEYVTPFVYAGIRHNECFGYLLSETIFPLGKAVFLC